MLVLTRHAKQSIVIGGEVVVTVLEVRGDQVRLGIEAPAHVEVHREEVFLALREAERGTSSAVTDLNEIERGTSAHPAGAGTDAAPSTAGGPEPKG